MFDEEQRLFQKNKHEYFKKKEQLKQAGVITSGMWITFAGENVVVREQSLTSFVRQPFNNCLLFAVIVLIKYRCV